LKVLFIDSVHPILEQRLTEVGMECVMYYPLSRAEILEVIGTFEGLVVRSRTPIDAELIAAAKELKFIARSGSGLENIDLDVCSARNISVYNAPEGNRVAVAEHAIGMLLSLFNHLSRCDAEVRQGLWRREENRGVELEGKTVGIIGFGQNGSAMAQRLSGFNCEILAYDKYVVNYAPAGVKETTMDELFQRCDVLSLHIPLTTETQRLVDEGFIAKFQKPIYIINTSRGPILNTRALLDALSSGKALGACLDVLEFERTSFENLGKDEQPKDLQELLASNKVVLSPHVAGWTVESYIKLSDILAEKILADWT
jgi:D-3-phosphoglycerate dehydrogenase / 2-oxoglutarate reductase